MSELSHFDAAGNAVMVDVSAKAATERVAVASGRVLMRPETLALIERGGVKKGDVLSVAQLAGIMGAKRTADLIPLCHQLWLTHIEVTFEIHDASVEINTSASTTAHTGVEMEALVAASVAALTIYDMAKGIDKDMEIGAIRLLEKVTEPAP